MPRIVDRIVLRSTRTASARLPDPPQSTPAWTRTPAESAADGVTPHVHVADDVLIGPGVAPEARIDRAVVASRVDDDPEATRHRRPGPRDVDPVAEDADVLDRVPVRALHPRADEDRPVPARLEALDLVARDHDVRDAARSRGATDVDLNRRPVGDRRLWRAQPDRVVRNRGAVDAVTDDAVEAEVDPRLRGLDRVVNDRRIQPGVVRGARVALEAVEGQADARVGPADRQPVDRGLRPIGTGLLNGRMSTPV